MNQIQQGIAARSAAIATLQDEIKVLQGAETLLGTAEVPRGTTKRKPIAERQRIKVGKAKDNSTVKPRNWSFQKYLSKEGRGEEASYTVTATGRVWMGV